MREMHRWQSRPATIRAFSSADIDRAANRVVQAAWLAARFACARSRVGASGPWHRPIGPGGGRQQVGVDAALLLDGAERTSVAAGQLSRENLNAPVFTLRVIVHQRGELRTRGLGLIRDLLPLLRVAVVTAEVIGALPIDRILGQPWGA